MEQKAPIEMGASTSEIRSKLGPQSEENLPIVILPTREAPWILQFSLMVISPLITTLETLLWLPTETGPLSTLLTIFTFGAIVTVIPSFEPVTLALAGRTTLLLISLWVANQNLILAIILFLKLMCYSNKFVVSAQAAKILFLLRTTLGVLIFYRYCTFYHQEKK